MDGETGPFSARWFDGRISRPRPVSLFLSRDGLRFEAAPTGAPPAPADSAWPEPETRWTIAEIDGRRVMRRHGRVVLYRLGEANAYLECGDPGLVAGLREALPGADLFRSPFAFLTGGKKRVFAASVGGLALLLGLYFFGVPAIGDVAGRVMPLTVERAIGDSIAQTALKSLEVFDDAETIRALDEVVIALGLEGRIRPSIVDDGKTMNAFAVMGGTILIYRKLFDLMEEPSELAGLVAHEYVHIERRHSARLLMRSLAAYFVISWFLGDASGLSAAVLQNADQLRLLQFSREMEAEADRGASELLESKGLEPRGLAILLERMDVERKGERVLGFLSSHPATRLRIAELVARPALPNGSDSGDPGFAAAFDRLKAAVAERTRP